MDAILNQVEREDQKQEADVISFEAVAALPKKSLFYIAWKRVFDVTASLLALVVLSPLMLLTALAIFLEDGGPVFFVQRRAGLNGKHFRMYKFRSMCKDADKLHHKFLSYNELDGPAFKMKHDPRVTRVGRFIRRTSIDELPQLLNIIRGDMSIVGPRPLPVYEAKQCSAYQNRRLLVKPGLTCYWQVMGRSDVSFEEWMALDLKYLRERGVLTDARIVLRTFAVIFKGGGRTRKPGFICCTCTG